MDLPQQNLDISDPLLSEKEASNFLRVKPQTLASWRIVNAYGLPYVKVGRLVRYRQSALEKFIASRTVGVEVAA